MITWINSYGLYLVSGLATAGSIAILIEVAKAMIINCLHKRRIARITAIYRKHGVYLGKADGLND
jgi:hypothetical protein